MFGYFYCSYVVGMNYSDEPELLKIYKQIAKEADEEITTLQAEVEDWKSKWKKAEVDNMLVNQALRDEVARLTKALKKYACPDNWENGQFKPCSPYNHLAKQALNHQTETECEHVYGEWDEASLSYVGSYKCKKCGKQTESEQK